MEFMILRKDEPPPIRATDIDWRSNFQVTELITTDTKEEIMLILIIRIMLGLCSSIKRLTVVERTPPFPSSPLLEHAIE